ncbi:malectin domain-containing carbohydrate-binding protein [Pontibacter sp. 13R65]|uniref:malectin domain-containing carbohydrate-binding protein n=1 Tax=Pontibacter sp. 13R65 TaxID=3127458 RepID=UPI00301B8292
MVVENLDKFPAPDRFTASRIQIPWRRTNPDGTFTAYNANHDKLRLKISNRGTGTLTINSLTLSNTTAWKIISINGSTPSLPRSLSTGTSVEVLIQFVAKDLGGRVKVLNNTLTINSNDALHPVKEVKLHGLWQYKGEGNNEPYAQEIINAFGLKTVVGFNANDGSSNRGTVAVPNSDEVLSPYFIRADLSKPVYVIQMAAYHGCCSQTEKIEWHAKGSTAVNSIFTHIGLDGQTLLPRKGNTNLVPADGSFSPSGAFGLKIQKSYTDRSLNYQGKIGVRIWKARDANGNIVPNAYIMAMDYLTSTGVNYDYQDNIYYVSNLKPETGSAHFSELAATPSAVSFGSLLTGSSKTISVNLKNLGKTYAGGNDPSIQLTSVANITGTNRSEFSVTAIPTTALAPQGSINLSVSFKPTTRGLKNAALLVHYNNASSPLRIPLYGIANGGGFTITAAKRIKGAADASMTIGGNAWEADVNYRKGSIKLDKQNVTTPIAATDDDVLYQTYLSASTNLAETRYEIPLSNGSYFVRMHFVENFFSAAGARVFSIRMENQLSHSGLDIYSEAGYRAALVKDYAVTVADGVLNLNFKPSADRLAIAGVEIYRAPSGSGLAASSTSTLEGEATDQKTQLLLYPNPSKGDNTQLELSGFARKEEVVVTLYDMLGRQIQVTTFITDDLGAIKTKLVLDRQVSRGIYLFKAQTTSGKAQSYLVIE